MIVPLQRAKVPPTIIVISSRYNNINATKPKAIDISSYPPPIQNPKLVLTHDVVRNTKTLDCTIYTSQEASPAREYPAALRPYADTTSKRRNKDISIIVELPMEECHQIWRREGQIKKIPLWHLKISVLRDSHIRENCPSKSFAFISQDTLNKAACQLEAAFSDVFDIEKLEEIPLAKGARIDNCKPENITISLAPDKIIAGWGQFLSLLSSLEREWADGRTAITEKAACELP
ncbi:hypothetical protein HYALB_00006419 [Hymenoscyphus albidus]|uniref:Uncharacterized protein n=1 Tax=Hymenoscyphus albidus TaxID=595503 RepID=A0A9N9Q4C0_9HELO|nr:hypothetical protein HYALB_00006419 [Hymenoscyphus albidus]